MRSRVCGTSVGMVGRMSARERPRILVVDDEESIRELVTAALTFARFDVVTAADGIGALNAASLEQPDLIVLDVTMPGFDGWEVCRRLRRDGDRTPVIFLTARDDVDDTLHGFDVGADDYITKPFSLEELVARVTAVLRRGAKADDQPTHLRYGDLQLDEEAHRVWRGDQLIDLAPTEFKLLRFFLLNPERVLAKLQILDHVWQYDFGGDSNVVETYVSYLRRKLGEPRIVHTVRGVGYVLRSEP